jgi:hypothetical protein
VDFKLFLVEMPLGVELDVPALLGLTEVAVLLKEVPL